MSASRTWLCAVGLILLFQVPVWAGDTSILANKIICIDPGHGGTALTDSYRVGPSGEREEWVNLRVALILRDILKEKGATVLMTRTEDVQVALADRAAMAVNNKADVFLSIHHNATADSTVNFPIIYFHGAASENIAGVALGKFLAGAFKTIFYKRITPVTVVSDYTVFAVAGAGVLRNSYGVPGLLAEASFFTNPTEELRLKQDAHNRNEANAYASALEQFFRSGVTAIRSKHIPLSLPRFTVLQEAERMSPVAKEWLNDYKKGFELLNTGDTTALLKALEMFTRSASSFPDSYVAGKCHEYRADILMKLGREQESEVERLRAREYFIKQE